MSLLRALGEIVEGGGYFFFFNAAALVPVLLVWLSNQVPDEQELAFNPGISIAASQFTEVYCGDRMDSNVLVWLFKAL